MPPAPSLSSCLFLPGHMTTVHWLRGRASHTAGWCHIPHSSPEVSGCSRCRWVEPWSHGHPCVCCAQPAPACLPYLQAHLHLHTRLPYKFTCTHACTCSCTCAPTCTCTLLHAQPHLQAHTPSSRGPTCAPTSQLCGPGLLCTTVPELANRKCPERKHLSLLTDARTPALVLQLRTSVTRGSSHIVSALEVMRLGTLPGSEAFSKPLEFKDAVKRARLSELGTRGRKLAPLFAEGLEDMAGRGLASGRHSPSGVFPLAVRFRNDPVWNTHW